MSIITPNTSLSLWKSYEYIGPGHEFHGVQYEQEGGPNGEPYIWADDSGWSIDTPENPPSILSLLLYRYWTHDAPIDLRNATVEFRLRGDNLDLKGGKCYFWAHGTGITTTRWHFLHQPIEITQGYWDAEPTRLSLVADPALWHRSFAADTDCAMDLDKTLRTCICYGFSFVGFSNKVTGKLSLGSFSLRTQDEPSWPYAAKFEHKDDDWQTVQRTTRKQAPLYHSLNASAVPDTTISIDNNALRIPHTTPFAYLAFIHSDLSTQGHDLRDALIVMHQYTGNFDLKGGNIHFFVEHAESGTRWIYLPVFEKDFTLEVIRKDPACWFLLTGNLPLEDILPGKRGHKKGYDYLGFMAVNVSEDPSGSWGIDHFSIGPNIGENPDRKNEGNKGANHDSIL